MRAALPLGLLALGACAPPARAAGRDAAAPPDARPAVRDGATAAAAAVARCGPWQVAEVVVRGSIAGSLAAALGEDGSQLAAHYARIFMWDLDLRRDVAAGDRMTLAWRRGAGGEIEIGAARYRSDRPTRVLRAYRFQAAEDEPPSYFDEAGLELPRRLEASPLRRYDQITALLKDRPTHKGMDFKTPTGTEVVAPRAGTVSRVDWRRKGNGRCLEVRYDDGVVAKFLHLSAVKVAGRARVKPGDVIALTGNTGRSTAPHLHYQLSRGTRTLDPLEYHGTSRRRLAGEALAALTAAIERLQHSCGAAAP
jgi:murein DD-endopeptidase MepM/ murein hydrolase activator NlpD